MNSVCASPFDAPLSSTTTKTSVRSSVYGLNNAVATSVSIKKPYWTKADRDDILALVRRKKTIHEIALSKQRTVSFITKKLLKYAVDSFEEGRSKEEIQKLTGLNKETIAAAIQKQEADKAKAKTEDNDTDSESKAVKPINALETEVSKVELVSTIADVSEVKPKAEAEAEAEAEPTMREMMAVLLDLQKGMKVLVPDDPEPTMRDLMKVVADIQKRMAVLLDKVQ